MFHHFFQRNNKSSQRNRKTTSKVRTIRKTRDNQSIPGDDVNYSLLDEIHLVPHGPLPDDKVPWLENFKLQFCDDFRDKVDVCVREERDRRHERSAVVVDNFLRFSKECLIKMECERTFSSFTKLSVKINT